MFCLAQHAFKSLISIRAQNLEGIQKVFGKILTSMNHKHVHVYYFRH